MAYHGLVRGPNGQIYPCVHNHWSETAAIRCANSSATRRMAAAAWNRAAMLAGQAAEPATRRGMQRAAAEPRWVAAQVTCAAGRAEGKAAAEQAKAAKRAAMLAAMSPQRAWKRMTPEERLLRTAEAELAVYSEILSPDAKSAHDLRAAKRAAADLLAAPGCVPPRTFGRPRGLWATGLRLEVTLWSWLALLRARVTARCPRAFESNAGIVRLLAGVVRLVVLFIAIVLLMVLLAKLTGPPIGSNCAQPGACNGMGSSSVSGTGTVPRSVAADNRSAA
jgi:hypothetical protein